MELSAMIRVIIALANDVSTGFVDGGRDIR